MALQGLFLRERNAAVRSLRQEGPQEVFLLHCFPLTSKSFIAYSLEA